MKRWDKSNKGRKHTGFIDLSTGRNWTCRKSSSNVGNGGIIRQGFSFVFFRLQIDDGITLVISWSGSRARNLSNSRSNSSVTVDFFDFVIGVDEWEFVVIDCSDDRIGDEWRGIFDDVVSFVLIVFMKWRISDRSWDVKLDWLWLSGSDDDGDDWNVEFERRLSRLRSRERGLN